MRTKTKADMERIKRRMAEYRSTKLGSGVKYRPDTAEMPPATLEARLQMYELRLRQGEPLTHRGEFR